MKRIIGQCYQWHFKEVAHLFGQIKAGEGIYMPNLTSSQKVAVKVIAEFARNEIPASKLKNIKKVILWEYEDGNQALEFILAKQDPELLQKLRLY